MLRIVSPRKLNYLAGAATAAFAIYAFVRQEPALGLTCLLLALILATTIKYTEFDFAAGYKGEFTSLFGFLPMGGRERLPQGRWLILKRFSELGIDDGEARQYQRYLIMLSVSDSEEAHTLLELGNLKQARRTANDLALAGQLELKDFTA